MSQPHISHSGNSRQRIIISNSDPERLQNMLQYLRRENYETIIAENCSDLLLKSLLTKVQLVILDAGLRPIGDRRPIGSRELIPILKNMHPNVKIVVCTEENSLQQETDFRQMEVFYYQVGESFSALMSVIRVALQQKLPVV